MYTNCFARFRPTLKDEGKASSSLPHLHANIHKSLEKRRCSLVKADQILWDYCFLKNLLENINDFLLATRILLQIDGMGLTNVDIVLRIGDDPQGNEFALVQHWREKQEEKESENERANEDEKNLDAEETKQESSSLHIQITQQCNTQHDKSLN